MTPTQHLHGLLLGTAIGDSVGLPSEGLSPKAITKHGWDRNWKHRLIFGRGLWSDDSEHTIILAQALNHSKGDPPLFQKHLARGLKKWLLFLPAGVGLATARALFKLWLGFPPEKSGVFSAGNGPMMRCALIGVVFRSEPETRLQLNRIQTRLTHTDPKAEFCARAIVELAALFTQEQPNLSLDHLFSTITFSDADADYRALIETIQHAITHQYSLPQLIQTLGGNPIKGVSGYCYHSLAAVLHCGIKHHWQANKALPAIWSAGGDTDTTGAILGALCGTLHGVQSLPQSWSSHLTEFPSSVPQLKELAEATIKHKACTIRPPFHPLLLLRNFLFLLIVLGHGLARLIPR